MKIGQNLTPLQRWAMRPMGLYILRFFLMLTYDVIGPELFEIRNPGLTWDFNTGVSWYHILILFHTKCNGQEYQESNLVYDNKSLSPYSVIIISCVPDTLPRKYVLTSSTCSRQLTTLYESWELKCLSVQEWPCSPGDIRADYRSIVVWYHGNYGIIR